MKTGPQMNLPNAGSSDAIEAGKLSIDADKYAPYLECKVSVSLANASGGDITLSDAQKQNFLSGYSLHLWHGAGQKEHPIDGKTLDVLDTLARYSSGVEWQGYADTTTGMGRTLTNGQTKAITLWARIPTGQFWLIGDEEYGFGIGPTQMKTVRIKATRVADPLPAGVTVSGSVVIEVRPGERPAHGRNVFTYIPEVRTIDETRETGTLEGGLFLGVWDTNAPQASQAALQNIRVTVGSAVITDGISHSDGVIEFIDVANLPTAGDTRDRWTQLQGVRKGTKLKDLPPGNVTVKQLTKDLPTMHLIGLYFPLKKREEVERDLNFAVSSRGENRPLRAVNYADLAGIELPDAIKPFMPMVFVEQSSPAYGTHPGLLASPSVGAHVDVPPAVKSRAKQQIAQHKANGDGRAIEAVIRSVAAAIPGAVQGPQGFEGGDSSILAEVRAQLA
jgi:hypothetical protein